MQRRGDDLLAEVGGGRVAVQQIEQGVAAEAVSTRIASRSAPLGFSLNSRIWPWASVRIRPKPSAWAASTGRAPTLSCAPVSM